jgi:hypothetical protein
MDLLEQLGALHHALHQHISFADPEAWRAALDNIAVALEAEPGADRFDRETLAVARQKIDALIAELDSGVAEPDFKPARTWVAALGAAVHRRREAARPSDSAPGQTH